MAGATHFLRLAVLLLGASILISCISAQRSRVRRQNMKVRINATGDTIIMTFVRPGPDVKLEGYILGYGSSMFSKQFIQLPEGGRQYQTEMDAEPKYLVAVQPIPVNDVKKHCTGKVNLEKPLHLVIGSVSPTAVLLSWGNYLKTPYEGNIMNECLEDGFYTIRYRERNRKWIYQTCPTSDTVIDNLKPNTPYEFGVRSNKDDRSGTWSKPVVHNTNMGNKNAQNLYKLRNPLAKPIKPLGPHVLFPPHPALHNRTQPRLNPLLKNPGFPAVPRTSFVFRNSQDASSLLTSANEKGKINSGGNDGLVKRFLLSCNRSRTSFLSLSALTFAFPPSPSCPHINLLSTGLTRKSPFFYALFIQRGVGRLHAAHDLTVMVASSNPSAASMTVFSEIVNASEPHDPH